MVVAISNKPTVGKAFMVVAISNKPTVGKAFLSFVGRVRVCGPPSLTTFFVG